MLGMDFFWDYSFSHNHGSKKRLYMKGYHWRDPFFTSMTMGGRVFAVYIGGLIRYYPVSYSGIISKNHELNRAYPS